jgi:hypothetical protein
VSNECRGLRRQERAARAANAARVPRPQLARLAKLAAIARCAENGIELLVTSNDSANAAMLAINTRLGYRPTIEHLAMTRQP